LFISTFFFKNLQLKEACSVTVLMNNRNFSSKFEAKRFMNHIIESRYEKILILWGAETLIELLEWYQHVGLFAEVGAIMKCLKDYSEEYYM